MGQRGKQTRNGEREARNQGQEPRFSFRIPHSPFRTFKWCSRQESHLQPPRSKRGALIIAPRERNGQREDAEGRRLSRIRRGLSLSTIFQSAIPPFEIDTDGNSFFPAKRTTNSVISRSALRIPRLKWWVATVLPRALRFKRPLHRCNACNPDGHGHPHGPRHEGGVEPPQPEPSGPDRHRDFASRKEIPERTEPGTQPGGRAQAPSTVRGLCRQARFTWEMDGHESIAPSTPVWKTGVCLSTPMPGESLNSVPHSAFWFS